MIAARYWVGPCADPPAFRVVPSDSSPLRPEACRRHLGELIATTLERHGLDVLTVERILPGPLVERRRGKPPESRPGPRRPRRGRFAGMQEVTRPDCGHGVLVAMYRYRLGSPEAIARAMEIAMAQPCPTCRAP